MSTWRRPCDTNPLVAPFRTLHNNKKTNIIINITIIITIIMPRTVRTQPEPTRRDSWPPTQISLYRSIEADEAATTKAQPPRRASLIEDDPITSFLTPTPLLDDGDTDDDMEFDDMDMDMAFDAGIEDSHRPSPVVRSISPSKLAGGLRSPTRSPLLRTTTPPHLTRGSMSPPSRNSPEICTPDAAVFDDEDDENDDGEDYVRFTPRGLGLVNHHNSNIHSMTSLNNYFGNSFKSYAKARKASKSAAVAAAKLREKEQDRIALAMARGGYVMPIAGLDYSSDYEHNNTVSLAPAPTIHPGRSLTGPTLSSRGSSGTSSPGRSPCNTTSPRSMSSSSTHNNNSWSAIAANIPVSGRMSPRAWREPSPDVWSIEEDVEGEVLGERDIDAASEHEATTRTTANKKAKGKGKGKKVRFAMPLRVEIP
ncbi:hypothetical protein BD289DRAFT_118685 [Coniella lustricola]|uniref:Uncharacterized protein n=1 Tax=Coniella lustricola TaxID=2025994 RepID=A0A2T3AG28_9PEZI|nr:hypothetical protein BD289DRAFT_118685 [Coniella lustricola]